MNKYEVMVIVKPAEEEATNAVIEKVEALIARDLVTLRWQRAM